MITSLLRKFMYGRYGGDHLSFALFALYLACYVASLIFAWSWISILSFVIAAVSLYRILSRNIARRRAENAAFLKFISPVVRLVRTARCRRRDVDHKYFRCPQCRQTLRVPRGKGRINITCRSCGSSFEKKS